MPYYPPPSASGGAPSDATYITQTANGTLSAEQNLAALSTGLMTSTTTTGVVATVAAPTGTVVGTTDAQVVSGKVLSDTFMGKEFDTRITEQSTTLAASQDYLVDDALENSASYVLEVPATSTLEIVPIVKQSEVQSYFGIYDFIESGCVWTADAAGSTLNATMSEGYVWISGRRLKVSAVKSRGFTASVDTYVDYSDQGNGTAKVTYTETTNNAATGSPTLAPGSLRNAIVVTAAGSIAAAASINQGQETMLVPIVSSLPYAVTDSLGNLICPRDPNRKILGQRQILANITTTSASLVDATGLNTTINVPVSRKVRIAFGSYFISNAAANNGTELSVLDATAGVEVFRGAVTSPGIGFATSLNFLTPAITPPTGGTRNYKLQWLAGAGTSTINAAATKPAIFTVELV